MKKKNPPTRPEAPKKHKRTIPGWKPWMEATLFALFAGWILIGMNSDYLFTVQERSLFLSNPIFWNDLMATPHGFVRWIGSYLTQFFYYPAIGSCLLILIWLGIYSITIKTFNLGNRWSHLALIPVTAMLCSVIGLGYWMYNMKVPGYWFSESIALLFVMLGTWAGKHIRGYWRYLWLGVWTVVGYPLMGWYALFGALLTAIVYTTKKEEKGGKHSYIPLVYAAALIGIVPLLWYQHYTQMRIEDAWVFGFPRFVLKESLSWITNAPFFVMAASCIALALCGNLLEKVKEKWSILARVVVIAGCALTIWVTNFDDYNYQAEMRMYRHAEESNWKEVLTEAREWKDTPTRQMVILKNLALMNLGQMGNQMFHYDNGSRLPHKRDELVVHLVHTAAPLLYYCHGKLNFATRWAIENGVEYGFDVNTLKILARCALVSGEYDVARKYVNLLKQTTFHREEGERLEEFCNYPGKIAQANEFKTVRELHKHINEDLDSDNGLCEMYLLHYFSNTMNIDSRLLQEVTLNYALISKNIQLFWPRFFQYANLHNGSEMPIHYQEAAYLYGNLEKTVQIDRMPFDKQKIKDRYVQFNSIIQYNLKKGLNEQEIGEVLKPTFGDTFWWFYYFCNNVGSY